MHQPTHHFPDEILLGYAAGTCPPAVALVVACHVTICKACRAKIEDYERVGGTLLLAEPPVALSDQDKALIDRIVQTPALPPVAASTAPRLPGLDGNRLPKPLWRHLDASHCVWKTVIPGVRSIDLDLMWNDVPVRLKYSRPGRRVPCHGHHGLEFDLVLQGGLHDTTRDERYEAGDVQVGDRELTHDLVVLPDEPCVVLSVNQGRARPVGMRSRLAYGWSGW